MGPAAIGTTCDGLGRTFTTNIHDGLLTLGMGTESRRTESRAGSSRATKRRWTHKPAAAAGGEDSPDP